MARQQTEDIGVYRLGNTLVHLQRKNVRTLRLRVTDKGEFYLSVPRRAPLAVAHEFLEEQRAWVENQRVRLGAKQARAPKYETGEQIPWWGGFLSLEVTENHRGRVKAEIQNGTMHLMVPPGATLEQRRQAVERLRKTSLEVRLAALLAKWAAAFGIDQLGKVRIRRMKTRWGSCNPHTRALTFNLELSARDPKFLEYVVAHELTHYFHSNHGPDFHALLATHLPNERALRRELNSRRTY